MTDTSNKPEASIVVTGETTTMQIVPRTLPGVAMESLPARIAAIEARQREYGMHDPGCPARLVERMNQNGNGPYYLAEPCTCWLSVDSGGVDL